MHTWVGLAGFLRLFKEGMHEPLVTHIYKASLFATHQIVAIKLAVTYHSEARRPGYAEEGTENAGRALLKCYIAAALRRCAQRSASCNEGVYAWGLPALQARPHPGKVGPLHPAEIALYNLPHY